MLTAVIRADGSASALAATFSVLIPAVADGFLGHAVVVEMSASAETERLADVTGASFLHCPGGDCWHAAASVARGDWLLLLDAGDVPQANWIQAVDRHLLMAADRAALLPLRGAVPALRERVAVSFAPRQLRAGLVAPKAAALTGRLASAPLRLSVARERATG